MGRHPFTSRASGDAPAVPFRDAEEAWFWFMRCQRLRREGARQADTPKARVRPCDPDDIYRVAISLFRRGRLSARELKVLRAFGERDRRPDRRYPEERRDHDTWVRALRTIAPHLLHKGIIAGNGGSGPAGEG